MAITQLEEMLTFANVLILPFPRGELCGEVRCNHSHCAFTIFKCIFRGSLGGPARDPGAPGSSPTSGSRHAACFSLLCLPLSLSLSQINLSLKKCEKNMWNIKDSEKDFKGKEVN